MKEELIIKINIILIIKNKQKNSREDNYFICRDLFWINEYAYSFKIFKNKIIIFEILREFKSKLLL